MNKTIKQYLDIFFTCEISDVEEDIKKETEYLDGVEDKRLREGCLTVISNLNEYLTALKTLYNRVEREEL